MAETEKKAAAVEAAAEPAAEAAAKPAAKKPARKPAAKRTTKKAAKPTTVTIKLIKSLSGRSDKQIATAASLGLKKVGDVTTQPDNPQTGGKIAKIAHMVAVTKA